MALSASGHELRFARTAREAFALGPRFRPEMVISELFLEGEDSYHWWRKLRTHATLADARFLAVTERYDSATVRVAREAGFEYVLAKPIDAYSLDEYLVGVSPRWSRHRTGAHPWPPVSGLGRMPHTEAATEEAPDPRILEEFLDEMQYRTARESSGSPHGLGSWEIPPVLLLRHLEVVKAALQAARAGDAQRGCTILRDELAAVRSAPHELWSTALSERYELALASYCVLFGPQTSE